MLAVTVGMPRACFSPVPEPPRWGDASLQPSQCHTGDTQASRMGKEKTMPITPSSYILHSAHLQSFPSATQIIKVKKSKQN